MMEKNKIIKERSGDGNYKGNENDSERQEREGGREVMKKGGRKKWGKGVEKGVVWGIGTKDPRMLFLGRQREQGCGCCLPVG